VAILTVGSLALRPAVDRKWAWKPGQPAEGSIVVAPTANMVLTIDHRVLDGAEVTPFLRELRERLESWQA
jgi:pyruvate/2-oxoglutarate dehydrogenase complex dihydrolipoamide acyltransferase (E2) component